MNSKENLHTRTSAKDVRTLLLIMPPLDLSPPFCEVGVSKLLEIALELAFAT